MNLRQHSEAAAKRSWNELPSPGQPLFLALFIFLKPSAMSDTADLEALLNGLQNPMPTHSNHWFWSLPGFTLSCERPCASLVSEPRWMPSPHHGLASGLVTRAASLSLHSPSHTDYTQHILILSFSHTSHVCLWMSQCDYSPVWCWSENEEHFPKTKTNRGKDQKTERSQAKHKSSAHNVWLGRTLGAPMRLSRSFITLLSALVLYRKLHSHEALSESRILTGG